MARVNIDILGISYLKWARIGEFNSDDHYIYYCGQESRRRNGVDLIVNKRVWKAVQFSCSVLYDSLWPHGLQHIRPPCPSPTLRVYSNSCPLSRSNHLIILCRPLLLLPPVPPSIRVFSRHSSRYHGHLNLIILFLPILIHWLLRCRCSLLPSPAWPCPIYPNTWT